MSEVNFGAHAEGFVLDEASGRAFVNVPDRQEIAVVDLATTKVAGTWKLAPRFANFPMALDAADHLIAVVFRLPSQLALFSEASGSTVAEAGVCSDADDIYFDERRQRLYISCGEGRIDAFQIDAGHLVQLASAESRAGARTSLYAPDLDRLFVAARQQPGSPAAILVYRPASLPPAK